MGQRVGNGGQNDNPFPKLSMHWISKSARINSVTWLWGALWHPIIVFPKKENQIQDQLPPPLNASEKSVKEISNLKDAPSGCSDEEAEKSPYAAKCSKI